MRTNDGGESWSDCSADLMRLARAAASQEQDRQRHLHRGHARRPRHRHQPGRSGGVILAVRMGLFRDADGGETWQDMEVGRFSPTTYGRDIKVSPQDGDTLYAALSVAAASKDGGALSQHRQGPELEAVRQGAGARHDHVGRRCTRRIPKQVYHRRALRRRGFGTQDGGDNLGSRCRCRRG